MLGFLPQEWLERVDKVLLEQQNRGNCTIVCRLHPKNMWEKSKLPYVVETKRQNVDFTGDHLNRVQ
jgi:hypothetical protein